MTNETHAYVALFEDLRMTDVESVGGKNASLGEMISQLAHAGVRVPGGFATTAHAFRDFLTHTPPGGIALGERIATRLEGLDIDDVRAHGKDERVSVASFHEGGDFSYRLIKGLSSDANP